MSNSTMIAAELVRALSADPDTTSLEAKTLDLGLPKPTRIEMPVSVNSESNIITGSAPFVSKQRTKVKIGNIGIDYDLNSSSGSDPNPADALKVNIPQPFNIGNSNLSLYGVGDWTKDDLAAVEFYKGLKAGKTDVGLDWGVMAQKGMNPLQWMYGNAKKGSLYGMVASLYPNNISKANLENSDFFANVGADFFDKFYASVGGSKGPRHNSLSFTGNTHGMENFGTLGIAVYNPKDENFFVKTRTASGDVSQGFYSKGFSNPTNELFIFPPFFFPHFTPAETKGNNTLMVDFSGNKEEGITQSEVRLGRNTKFGRFGAGVYTDGEGSVPSFMFYTPLKVGDIQGGLELGGNETKGFGAYLTLNTNFGSK